MPEWLIPILSCAGGALGVWGMFRIRFERFEAMDIRREADWKNWRADVDMRLRRIEERPANGYAAIIVRVGNTEDRVDELKEWKHVVGEAYLPAAADAIKERVDRMENRLTALEDRRR